LATIGVQLPVNISGTGNTKIAATNFAELSHYRQQKQPLELSAGRARPSRVSQGIFGNYGIGRNALD
jgi:hypothetical protein